MSLIVMARQSGAKRKWDLWSVVFVSLCICQGVDDKSPEWIQVSVVVVVVRVLGQQLKSIYSAKEIFTSHHPRTIIY